MNKRLTSAILAIMLVLAMAVPALATSITIEGGEGRTFQAYKILDATTSGDAVSYTVPEKMKGFYETYFGLTFADKTPGQIYADGDTLYGQNAKSS